MKLSENCHSEPKARNLTLTATFRSREREFRMETGLASVKQVGADTAGQRKNDGPNSLNFTIYTYRL